MSGRSTSHVQAGTICFLEYDLDMPSLEIAERIVENQSTLIVPGSHFAL